MIFQTSAGDPSNLHPPEGGAAGTRAGAGILSACLRRFEQPFRSFTQRLLKQDAWLLVFYAHLFVLYVVSASCLANTIPSIGSTPECVEMRMRQGNAATATIKGGPDG